MLAQAGCMIRAEAAIAHGTGRAQRGVSAVTLPPQPQGFGSMVSWPVSFPALYLSSTALDLPPCCPQWWPCHEEHPQGLAQLWPRSLPLASFRAVCGAGLSPSRLHRRLSASPGSSGRCAGSSPWPHPCCSSGLALWLVLLSLCQGHPCCAGHQPGISHVRVLCHLLCASVMCLLCPYSMSLQHVPCLHSMSGVPTS